MIIQRFERTADPLSFLIREGLGTDLTALAMDLEDARNSGALITFDGIGCGPIRSIKTHTSQLRDRSLGSSRPNRTIVRRIHVTLVGILP